MSAHRFDDLTKRLPSRLSRRRLLTGTAAVGVTLTARLAAFAQLLHISA